LSLLRGAGWLKNGRLRAVRPVAAQSPRRGGRWGGAAGSRSPSVLPQESLLELPGLRGVLRLAAAQTAPQPRFLRRPGGISSPCAHHPWLVAAPGPGSWRVGEPSPATLVVPAALSRSPGRLEIPIPFCAPRGVKMMAISEALSSRAWRWRGRPARAAGRPKGDGAETRGLFGERWERKGPDQGAAARRGAEPRCTPARTRRSPEPGPRCVRGRLARQRGAVPGSVPSPLPARRERGRDPGLRGDACQPPSPKPSWASAFPR